MTDIINRLNSKKEELEERLAGQYHGGSQRREALQYKIKKIEELIEIYQNSPSSNLNLPEVEEILSEQIGFEEQKRIILESLETEETERFREQYNISPKPPLILCFTGSPGIGKTSFAKILAQALKREFFSISLAGLSDTSILTGTSENSSGTEIGQLTRALIETKSPNPVILLDEIDKAGSSLKNAIQDCLVSILDPTQNQEIIDYYLDVKLDFSQILFVITANDLQKIPRPLRDRMQPFELPEYTTEQKKKIAQKIIQKQFASNEELRDKLKITSEALEILIGKIHEKGVRQLKWVLENKIFDYCLQKWAQESFAGEPISEIIITPGLIHQIVPYNYRTEANDQEAVKNNEERIKTLQKELKSLCQEKDKLVNILAKNNQNKLKASKFKTLGSIKKALSKTEKNETILTGRDYEAEIDKAVSVEEIEAIREEILFQIITEKSQNHLSDQEFPFNKKEKPENESFTQKKYSSNFPAVSQNDKILKDLVQEISKINEKNNLDSIKNLENKLIKTKQKSNELKKQFHNLQKNFNREIQSLKEQNKFKWNIKNNAWFILFVIILVICGIFMWKLILKQRKKKTSE